ncbi:MAG: tRNA (guanosine(37)-N1)-methyltransferase TrmD [Pseudomonadales bacterium]|nr:tRNA (guanosine(37)-N1)-methyltransferase TrmD [Pseudomonadales bacterium]
MQIGVITLFPEMVNTVTEYGVTGRAVKRNLLSLQCWNPRDYTQDQHRTVDDRPYGGGPGMLMKVEPLRDAISAAREKLGSDVVTVYLSPQGEQLNQQKLNTLVGQKKLLLISGRYEGIDERVINMEVDQQWSLGDFVLSGGELAAMVVIDAVTRLIPGVLGDDASALSDSFSEGLLDFPHYTRPEVFEGQPVPAVLLSGNHERIRAWRLKQSLGVTWLKRPDLLKGKELNKEQKQLLEEFIEEWQRSETSSE